MTFLNLNLTNNARDLLLSPISSTSTSVIIASKGDLFPSSNSILTIEKRDTTNLDIVTRRENIFYSTRTWNIFTWLTRAYEAVPIDDTVTTATQQPLSFDAWDIVSVYTTAKNDKDIKDEIVRLEVDKLNKWELRTWLANTWKMFFSNNSNNEEEISFWLAWTVLQSNWVANNPSWVSPSVNINWLATEAIKTNDNDLFVIYNSVSLQNEKIKSTNIIPRIYGWDWTDWILNLRSGTVTIPIIVWENWTWFIEKNYSSISITWWTLNFNNLQSSWNIIYIKCKWNFTMSWGTINASWTWPIWWSGWTTDWVAWNPWKVNNFPIFTNYTNWGLPWARRVASPTLWGASVLWKNVYINDWNIFLFMWWSGAEGGRGWDAANPYWGNGGRGGWILIIEVWWEFNFTSWTINNNWENWSDWEAPESGWGGGWGGGCVLIKWKKLIANTWTINVNWWNGGNGANNSGWYTSASWWSGGGSVSASGKWWECYTWTVAWENWWNWVNSSWWNGGVGGTGGTWENSSSGWGWWGGGWAWFKYLFFNN